MSIKTVVFTKNASGIDSIRIDTKTQTIYSCPSSPAITGRHYRLSGQRGERISFRVGDKYVEIPADIKSIV